MRWWWLLVVISLAGCADGSDSSDAPVMRDSDQGLIRGVVVDAAVVPLEGIDITLAGTDRSTTTDDNGQFTIDDVAPGTYVLEASSLVHEAVQVAVTVVAGGEQEVTKIQMKRLFVQDAYMDQQEIRGYMNCGYSAGLSSPCILDYTQLLPVCPGGCAPQLYGIAGDVRRFVVPMNAGWQSRINEIVWDPSTGTSESLGMTISFYNRTSSHSYTSAAGPSPLRHQMDMDPEQDHPEWVPPEGKHDYLVFVNPSRDGSRMPVLGGEWPVALMVEQTFELFVSTFYFGLPPEGWSFAGGDSNPF
ncbi:MAG: carboxypeptidase-like regulatory domain-containing protein [Thermoplasmatota archaeon]